jgi:hypothetical protein
MANDDDYERDMFGREELYQALMRLPIRGLSRLAIIDAYAQALTEQLGLRYSEEFLTGLLDLLVEGGSRQEAPGLPVKDGQHKTRQVGKERKDNDNA